MCHFDLWGRQVCKREKSPNYERLPKIKTGYAIVRGFLMLSLKAIAGIRNDNEASGLKCVVAKMEKCCTSNNEVHQNN